ncbi:type III PLP-dependent enzyme [Streptomyces sp. NPDC057136]|uniref:type III PLP-dependent enzyme n=1 Tax=Streptomyces sp. NPDC057136 TaxID=3346029 RepID=UPI00363CFBC5
MSRRKELVQRFGSPLYVYDLDRVRAARQDLRAALPPQFTLFYSLKANPHPEIARALGTGEGACRAEVCSMGELDSALEAGFPAAEILYGGPGKTAAELDQAVRAGVRHFSVESVGDLRRVGAVATDHDAVADCLLRVNSESSAATSSIRMTGTPSQFGIDGETLADSAEELRSVPGTRLVGAHFFPLSNARDEESLISEFRQSIEAAARMRDELGLPMRFLDIGGGFAASYAGPGERPRYQKLRGELEQTLDVHFPGWREGEVQIACESGRYLVGDSGELLTRVTNIKTSRGRKFVILDAGINTFGGMAGLGRLLPLSITVDADRTGTGEGEPQGDELATLVGPLCTPGDILGRNVSVPALSEGDLVTIPNAGAYGATASLLHFLSRPAPAEVLVSGDEVVSATRLETARTRVPE